MGDLLGSGLAFPLRVDARGGLALAPRTRTCARRSRVILGTAPGERPMRPEFGCGVHDYVFDVDRRLHASGASSTRCASALDRWEPRIEVLDVELRPSSGRASGVLG